MYTSQYPFQFIACDIILTRYVDNNLEILLVTRGGEPYKGMLALPGGFLNEGELIEDCAKRELFEETNIDSISPYFVSFADKVNRDPRQRTISAVYAYHFDGDTPTNMKAGDDAADAQWYKVKDIEDGKLTLAFDHYDILSDYFIVLSDDGEVNENDITIGI